MYLYPTSRTRILIEEFKTRGLASENKGIKASGWRSKPFYLLILNFVCFLKMGATGFDGIISLFNCMSRFRNLVKHLDI